MKQLLPFRLASILVLLLVCGGCTEHARIERRLQRGDRWFALGKYDAAEIEYLNVLTRDGTNPRALGRLAVIYFEEGLTTKSVNFFAGARIYDPDNLAVRDQFALCMLSLGSHRQARQEAEFVLGRNPADADAPLILAEAAEGANEIAATRKRLQALPPAAVQSASVLVAEGVLFAHQQQWVQARAKFDAAIRVDPKSSTAWSSLAVLSWQEHNLKDAESDFARAAELASPRSPKHLQYATFEIRTGNAKRGREILEQLHQQVPDFVSATLMLAQFDETDGRNSDALALASQALARDPSSAQGLLIAGTASMNLGDFDKATSTLEVAVQLWPSYPQVRYELAQVYYRAGKFDQAIAALNRVVAMAPEMTDAALTLAELKMKTGDWASAVTDLQRLLQKQPNLDSARYQLAAAYAGGNDFDSALREYAHLINAHLHDPRPLVLAAEMSLKLKHGSDALRLLERARLLAPNYFPALEDLVYIDLSRGRNAQARKRIDDQLAKTPKMAEAHLLLGRILLVQHQPGQAEPELKTALALSPTTPEAYYLLSQVYYDTGQDKLALGELDQLVKKNPQDARALVLVGTIQERERNFPAARQAYDKAIAADPAFSPALNNLAYLEAENLGDLASAQSHAQRAKALLPNDPHVADTLGWILYKRGQYTWALSVLQEANREAAASPERLYHLGMTQYMLGEEGASRATFAAALRSPGDWPGRETALECQAVLQIDPAAPRKGDLALLEKAAAARPNDPSVLIRLAGEYELQGRTADAIKAGEGALAASPNNIVALVRLARLHAAQGDLARALELGRKARSLSPADPELDHLLGVLAYRSHDYPWSYSLLSGAAAAQPADLELRYDLGQSAYSLGKVAEAADDTRAALAAPAGFGRRAEADRFLALLDLADHPAPAAGARVSQLAASDPGSVPALMALGAAAEAGGNLASARADYRRVLGIFPKFTPAARRLVLQCAADGTTDPNLGDWAAAAREAYPDDRAVAQACGIIAYRSGDYMRAATLLEGVAGQDGGSAAAAFYLGMAEARLHDKRSRASLERALTLKLDATSAEQARAALAQLK